MELKLNIPQNILNHSPIAEYDYAAPFDIYQEKYVDGFLIVDHQKIQTYHEGFLFCEWKIENFTSFNSKSTLNGGYIYGINQNKEEIVICSCGKKYFSRLANIALGLSIFLKEHFFPTSDENEPFCPKCGRVYPYGLNHCMYCRSKTENIKKLWGFTQGYRWLLLLQYLIMLFPIAIDAINPMIYEKLANQYLIPKNTYWKGFVVLILMIALVYFIKSIIKIIEGILNPYVSFNIAHNIRLQVYDKIQKLSLASANKKTTGSLISRVSRDTQQVQWFLSYGLPSVITPILTCIVVLLIMLFMDYQLALWIILPLPVIYFSRMLYKQILWPKWDKNWKQFSKANTTLHDLLNGIKVIKTYSKEEKEIQHFQKVNWQLKEYEYDAEKTWRTMNPIIWFVVGIGEVFLIFVLGKRLIHDPSQYGNMLKWMSYSGMLYSSTSSLSNSLGTFLEFRIHLEKINEILEEDTTTHNGKLSVEIEGNVEFKNTRFGYLSYNPVLKNLNVSIKKGEMIGIVGHSGSGKTTMVNLLMKLYSPDSGKIYIDGYDLEELNSFEYRKQLGVVIQETFLFSGTILENIRYGNTNATLEEVMEAAKAAKAHDFIIKKPFGYDTKLGNKGFGLSGGEKQRIAIARAILNQPKIFILDEATSSLDTLTEKEIQDALARIIKGKTTFVIAHRLATLKNADKLIVLDKGEMVEFGTHKELLAKKGYYYQLVNAQKMTYEKKN